MTDPLFWLVLSLLFVSISLTIVLAVAIPTLKELARAARSADKLFDTLRREFPPTLQAIRLTGMEISDLTDNLSEGVQSAGNVVKQVDQSLSNVRKQAHKVNSGTRKVMSGIKAAWKTFMRPQKIQRRSPDRLSPVTHPELDLGVATSDASRRILSEASLEPQELQPAIEPGNFQATNNRYASESDPASPGSFSESHQLPSVRQDKTATRSSLNPNSSIDDARTALPEDAIADDLP